jgi:hypothetical protein
MVDRSFSELGRPFSDLFNFIIETEFKESETKLHYQ